MKYYCAMILTGCEKSFKEEAELATKDFFPSTKFFFLNADFLLQNVVGLTV